MEYTSKLDKFIIIKTFHFDTHIVIRKLTNMKDDRLVVFALSCFLNTLYNESHIIDIGTD